MIRYFLKWKRKIWKNHNFIKQISNEKKKLTAVAFRRGIREHLIEARVFNNLICSLCEDLGEILLQSRNDFTQKQFTVLVDELVADLTQVGVAVEEIFEVKSIFANLDLQIEFLEFDESLSVFDVLLGHHFNSCA